jgi:hypothetical protein
LGRHKFDEAVEQRFRRHGRVLSRAALTFFPQRHRPDQPSQQQAGNLRFAPEVGLPRLGTLLDRRAELPTSGRGVRGARS